MAATIVCSHCGIEQTVENSVAYLTGWSKFFRENRKTTLFGAATKAQAAADYILGKASENEQYIHAEVA
jgi:antirestriction protein ArdC